MEKFQFVDLFNLKKMITPSLLTIVYLAVMVVAVIATLVTGFSSMGSSVIGGLFVIIVGIPLTVLAVRVAFESVIVMFNINENLQRLVELKGAETKHEIASAESVNAGNSGIDLAK